PGQGQAQVPGLRARATARRQLGRPAQVAAGRRESQCGTRYIDRRALPLPEVVGVHPRRRFGPIEDHPRRREELVMRRIPALLILATLVLGAPAHASDTPQAVVLFENVRVFDGKGDVLSAPTNVLVRGNRIERISTAPIPVDRRADTRIIAGGGRTLMPGLIDAHWHAMMASV